MALGGGPLEFLRAFRGTPRLEVFGCQKRSKNARFLAPRRGTKTRGFWRPDQNTRFLLRTRKNTTGAEAAHEPARRERLWRTKMSCFYVDARSKMLPCVPARGRPPPRTCFYVGGLCRPEGLPLVFLRTGDRNSAQIGTRGALAARGDRSDPDSDRFVLNRGRPHVKTRVQVYREAVPSPKGKRIAFTRALRLCLR